MIEEVVFGKCLNELLMSRGWSAARLAREINLDASYIRKWIRGERVPSIKSDYIEQIVNCLCASADGTGSRNLKENYIIALENLGTNPQRDMAIDKIVKDALTSSQVYSLKLSTDERMLKSTTTEDDVVSLLERIGKENRNPERAITIGTSYNLSSIPALIKGREAVLSVYITLLRAAQEISSIKKGEIIITFQSDSHPFDGYQLLEQELQAELARVLTNGWRVRHLFRLNRNVNRSIKLVKRIVQLVGFNRQYEPFYFENYGTMRPAFELLIVEGIGALMCFASEDSEHIDTAFFHTQPEAIQSLHKFYMQAFQLARPLLKVYGLNDYFIFNTEADKKHSDRYIIRNDLDSLTLPLSLWAKYLKRTFKDEDEMMPHLARLSTRLNAFYQQAAHYRFMNICTIEAVEHLLRRKEYLYDNVYRIPSPQDIVEHIENIIYLLKTYKSYEIGLLTEDQMSLLPPAYWEVKGDYSVIIDMWRDTKDKDSPDNAGLFLAITEATIAGSFREYFLELWDRISPNYRDKEYVIHWFEQRLQWFKTEQHME